MIRINYDRRNRFTLDDVKLELIEGKLKLIDDRNCLVGEARYRPISVTADGDALLYIASRIQNIPLIEGPIDRPLVWHGNFAKFIVYNLDIDWDWPMRLRQAAKHE